MRKAEKRGPHIRASFPVSKKVKRIFREVEGL